MSLSKQLYLIIIFIFFVIFTGNFIISVKNTKEYLELESQTKAQDTATSLGMSLRPLIKECIKEVILEEGVLSSVVSEVVKGMGASTIVEQKPAPVKEERLYNVNSDSTISRVNESRKQLMDAINKDAYN
ncbi:MAG: LapD/MoxY N-terminal periplasmic domain-containing protein, partial [Halarcobacter sp.]